MLSKSKYSFKLGIITILILAFAWSGAVAQLTTRADSLRLERELQSLKDASVSNPDTIIVAGDRLLSIYGKPATSPNRLKIYRALGFVLSKHGYFQLTERYYREAVEIARKTGNQSAEADLINSLGVMWAKKGEYIKAESSFLKALIISEKARYVPGIVSSYLKLSTLRIKQNKPVECLSFCKKADSVNAVNHVSFLKQEILRNKGIVKAMQGHYAEALASFNTSYKIGVEEKDVVDQVVDLQNIGLVYKEQKHIAEALSYLKKAASLAKSYYLKEEEVRVEINIPPILASTGNFDEAEALLLALDKRAIELSLIDMRLEIYTKLSELSEQQKNYRKAYRYLGTYTELRDKQANEESGRVLQEAQVNLGLLKANKRLKENEDLLFQKTRERNILFGVLLFCSLLLGALVFALLRLKNLNWVLSQKKEQLSQSNSSKNKLLSIIGHDLRGHESTSLGLLGLLKNGDLTPEEADVYLGMLLTQTESALATLEDLLLWGQTQIKGGDYKPQNLMLSLLIDRSVALNTEAIQKKELDVQVDDLQGKEVNADAHYISFVMRNLLANAIKFTPNKGIIKIYAEDYSPQQYSICVADDGIGIPPEQLEQIFSPQSISRKGTNNESGTGLGLTLCKEFVEANGGKIWAHPGLQGGTVFCFTLNKKR
ncbi:hypothetical protein BCY91_16090 [Pelobium manganitolerans]|uniref:histidine kinase n=1 Tax=Pelobium manganitolerans TaxID=1842495 RepID=A0A419S8T9_9SPHI|nr:ATP-binding protein [Pelobium manganitolerans]RKD18320.1 hypothetical protein BCY91_16090 [Pelobium manganitolerans]